MISYVLVLMCYNVYLLTLINKLNQMSSRLAHTSPYSAENNIIFELCAFQTAALMSVIV